MKQKDFAARLASKMERAGLTPYALAKLADMPSQTLYRYLSGERKPTLEAAKKLADALGCKVDDLC